MTAPYGSRRDPVVLCYVRATSLEGDGGAGALEGLLGLLRGLLGSLLQDGLGRGLDQVLGLLETEGGERAHLLDDVDLLLAGGLQDDVELVLRSLLLGTARGAAASGGGSGNGDRSGGGDAEGVLELLDELAQLNEGHLLERVEQLVGGELRHGGVSFHSVARAAVAPGPGFRWCVPGPRSGLGGVALVGGLGGRGLGGLGSGGLVSGDRLRGGPLIGPTCEDRGVLLGLRLQRTREAGGLGERRVEQ